MKLKELRQSAKQTQAEVAKAIHISQQTYSKYEANIVKPSIETLLEIADYFNVSLDYILERDFKHELGFLTDEEHETIKNFLSLSETDQGKVIGYIDSLKQKKLNH